MTEVMIDDPFEALAAQPDPSNEPWYERAVCPQTDPEAFYPKKGGSTREAKRICRGCPVIDQCLQWALDNDERFGIWGGLSERERRRLKRGIDEEPADRGAVTEPIDLPVVAAAEKDLNFDGRLAG
jgi:WhiB family transcriptional regulator, redox-sensing transcriptional regulator